MICTWSNIPASIAARPLHRAKETGNDSQAPLTAYLTERYLYRLTASTLRDPFLLALRAAPSTERA